MLSNEHYTRNECDAHGLPWTCPPNPQMLKPPADPIVKRSGFASRIKLVKPSRPSPKPKSTPVLKKPKRRRRGFAAMIRESLERRGL